MEGLEVGSRTVVLVERQALTCSTIQVAIVGISFDILNALWNWPWPWPYSGCRGWQTFINVHRLRISGIVLNIRDGDVVVDCRGLVFLVNMRNRSSFGGIGFLGGTSTGSFLGRHFELEKEEKGAVKNQRERLTFRENLRGCPGEKSRLFIIPRMVDIRPDAEEDETNYFG